MVPETLKRMVLRIDDVWVLRLAKLAWMFALAHKLQRAIELGEY